MALAENEVWVGGFLRDADTVTADNALGALIVTTDPTDAVERGGFLRDPDGRLVVVDGG